MKTSARSGSDTREIRIALVLYGGVSLAVYENGVTRCFYDLVRGRGVFGPMLRLLGAHATVDVVAGTSAGGINGLLLAACLESGQDFAHTAAMWRRLGDLGDLMRNVRDKRGNSLIDGEGYYQSQLLAAMRRFCEPDPDWESPGEMDLFITGTDVAGHERSYVDGLGQTVEDKEHRTVFHLQHRPGRKRLGLTSKLPQSSDIQAAVLAAVARITSCFPVAFPPFRTADMGKDLEPLVGSALCELSGVETAGEATYVDGGVLDNKPFGPALKAIFHRMPGGPVDRRLFYCEPDPAHFESDSGEYTPLAIGLSALSSIPANESIGGDLDQLKQHNERIAWLESVKQRITATNVHGRNDFPAYVATRIDAVARSLTVDGDSAPSAADVPRDEGRAALCTALRDFLAGQIGSNLDLLDPADVHFHLRRAYHLLYAYYDKVEAGTATSEMAAAMRLVGRVVKSLKLIRDCEVRLRDVLVPRVAPDTLGAGSLVRSFGRFLDSGAVQWKPLLEELASPVDFAAAREDECEAISSRTLGRTSKQLRALVDAVAESDDAELEAVENPGKTILDILADKLADIADALAIVDPSASRAAVCFPAFDHIDAHLYPLEFASGVYELDMVEFVRISPGDAQIGLSCGNRCDKVAGDELAHFAALLRRDWRSNDILYGRLDGICQIVRALLDEKALRRILARDAQAPLDFRPEALAAKGELDRCPTSNLDRLALAWQKLRSAWSASHQALVGTNAAVAWRLGMETLAEEFRLAFILAGQEQAVAEDLVTVFADIQFQEVAYGFMEGPDKVAAPTNADLVEHKTFAAARSAVDAIAPERRSAEFRQLRLGAQAITGSHGRVPNAMIGEYATQAYLLIYRMLEQSFGDHTAELMGSWKVKAFFRHPPRVIHAMLTLIRRERRLAAMMLVGALFAGLGGLLAWYVNGDPQAARVRFFGVPFVCVLIVLISSFALRQMSSRHKRPRVDVDAREERVGA